MDFADLARGIAALALTLGLIGLAGVLARRYGPSALFRTGQPKAERRMAVVETLMLDPARRLVLVRVGDREQLLLLGEGRVLADLTTANPARGATGAGTGAEIGEAG